MVQYKGLYAKPIQKGSLSKLDDCSYLIGSHFGWVESDTSNFHYSFFINTYLEWGLAFKIFELPPKPLFRKFSDASKITSFSHFISLKVKGGGGGTLGHLVQSLISFVCIRLLPCWRDCLYTNICVLT